MLIYTLAFLISGAFAYLYYKSQRHMTLFSVLSALPLALVASFRYGLGTDYMMYLGMYQSILFDSSPDLFGNGALELGYYWLEILAASFDFYGYGIFFLSSFITWLLIYNTIFRLSPTPVYTIFLVLTTGFFFFTMNVMRQSLAIAVFIYSLRYILNRNFIKFLFCMGVAYTLHYSALLFIPFYFIVQIKITVIRVVVFSVASAIVAFFSGTLIQYILPFTYYGSKYLAMNNANYLDADFGKGFFLVTVSILIYITYFCKRLHNDIRYRILVWSELLTLVAIFFTSQVFIFFRVETLFRYIMVCFLPMVFLTIKSKEIRFFSQCIIAILFIVYMYDSVIVRNVNGILPYVSIFD